MTRAAANVTTKIGTTTKGFNTEHLARFAGSELEMQRTPGRVGSELPLHSLEGPRLIHASSSGHEPSCDEQFIGN
jgi:hypothetical protein